MKLILITILSLFSIISAGQTLTQDAEGKSAVLYYGGSVGFDLSKPRLSFSYSNLRTKLLRNTDSKPEFIWGINAYGSNVDNVANIFDGGQFQPETGYSGTIGIRVRMDKVSARKSLWEGEIKILEGERDVKTAEYNSTMDPIKKAKLEAEQIKIKEAIKELDLRIKGIQSELRRRIFLIYARGGQTASSFKLSSTNSDPSGLSVLFKNEKFEGNIVSGGINYESGPFLVGVEMGGEFVNNLKEISSKKYTLTIREVVGNQTLESKSEITAYKESDYMKYNQGYIKIDLIAFSAIAEHNYVAWNLYARNKWFDKPDNTGLTRYINIGAGAYFFNNENKFLGGFYVEAPDVSQNKEKLSSQDANIQSRLTFGVVARFNFASIVGPTF